MDIKYLNSLLNDSDLLNKFIETSEENILAAPENFASSVMAKINAKTSVKVIPFISRKMRAAVCFCSAFAIMASTLVGVNRKIFSFLADAVTLEKIGKIGEFLNIISKFNLK